MKRILLLQVFALSGWLTSARAEGLADDLARRSLETGKVRSMTSTKTDPIGVEGLWGMEGDFVVDVGCPQSYAALTRVTEYPKHTNKVKRVAVRRRTEGSLEVDYTEGGFGFESTSTQLWTFEPSPVPSITAKSVGAEDAPSWLQMTLHDTGHPDYCDIHVKVFADISIVPNFVMSWMTSTAAKELAKTYRAIIHGAVEPQE